MTSPTSLLSLLTVVTSLALTLGRQVCDHCDCHISSAEGVQAVYSMSLVCNAGTITWFDAYGGVRLELSPYVHSHFRACFMAEAINTQVKISQETSHPKTSSSSSLKSSSTSSSSGSSSSSWPSWPTLSSSSSYSPRHNYQLRRLKAEQERDNLVNLASTSNVKAAAFPSASTHGEFHLEHLLTSTAKSKEFCVDAGPGRPLHLFLETAPLPGVHGVPKVKFHYDVSKLTPVTPQDAMDECRPCSKEEILDAYCTMDFVVMGQMTAMTPNSATERSDITVTARQVIHQREPQFFQRVKRSDPHLTGTVQVSSHCGLKPGSSDMLLTGRLRLNSLTLTCATYLHEWRRIQGEVECER